MNYGKATGDKILTQADVDRLFEILNILEAYFSDEGLFSDSHLWDKLNEAGEILS